MANNIFGTEASEGLLGTSGNDAMFGFGGDDVILAGNGNDFLTGGAGADRLEGGAGRDQAIWKDSPVGVRVFLSGGRGFGGEAEGDVLVGIEDLAGSEFDDVLSGDDSVNALFGRGGNDTLKGAGGNDVLLGDGGDDILMGGSGADELNGGGGVDTASYSGSSVGVVVSLITNVAAYGDAQGDTFTLVENLIGTSYTDTLIGHDGANVISGGGGNDTLKGFGGNDTLRGEDGNDILMGGSGDNTMIGGLGSDTYLVDNRNDVIVEAGGQGIDLVRTSVSYVLTSGADVEILETSDPNGTAPLFLLGNANGNTIIGNNGDNRLNGQGGVDQAIGRGGNDTYLVDNANDSVIENGGQGNDTVFTSVSWVMTPGSDVELLATVAEVIATDISLTGNANGNVIRGNFGNNTINGGDGRDQLTGLAGQDRFLFDTPLGAGNVDVITDYAGGFDTILLDQDIFSSSLGLGNISAGELAFGTAAQDANDRIIYDRDTGALFYDNDGAGGNAQVQFATLNAVNGTIPFLTNLDFLVV
jgi:Ca2+-binding RTX toxin-like protein